MTGDNASGRLRRLAGQYLFTAWGALLGAAVVGNEDHWFMLVPAAAITVCGMLHVAVIALAHDREHHDG